jgi:hypothetical protein
MRARAAGAFRAPPGPPPPPDDAIYLGRHPERPGEYIYITARELDTHLQIIGGSRRGKTNTARLLCKQLLARKKKTGEGFALIDPHGGLAEYVLALCAKDPALADEVAYLTLNDTEWVLSINPLMRTGQDPFFVGACMKEALIKAFDRVRSQDLPLINTVLTNMGQALNDLGLTLLESRYFLNRGATDRAVLASKIAEMSDPELRSFWDDHLEKSEHVAEMRAMGPTNRLLDLIRPQALKLMLGQATVSLDFLELMNRGGIAIFNTSVSQGTEITTDGQDLFNALLVQQFRQAFPRRKEKGARDYDPTRWPPFTLIMDEFGSYCSVEFARTLTEASKFGLRCVFMHHTLEQLRGDGDDRLLKAVLAIPNKVVFGALDFDEAEQLAKHIYLADLNPDDIKYQGETVTWDPVDVWGVTSTTRSRQVTREPVRRTHAKDRSSGGGRSVGTVIDPDTGRQFDQESTQDHWSERESDSETTADGPTITEGETVVEGWRTTHRQRTKKDTPVYRPVEEQVFKAAQTLSTNSRGVCVLAVEDRKPQLCNVPKMDDHPTSVEECDQFLELNHTRRDFYLRRSSAIQLLEERHAKLLADAVPAEGRVKAASRGSGKGAAKKKPTLPPDVT